MTRLSVDLDALADLVDRMARLHDQVGRTCADADARVQQLHDSWGGAAAAAHAATHAEWRAAAGEVHAALATLCRIASTAHANYHAAVAANRRMWTR
jgi:WXG100 family type VII secretion target